MKTFCTVALIISVMTFLAMAGQVLFYQEYGYILPIVINFLVIVGFATLENYYEFKESNFDED